MNSGNRRRVPLAIPFLAGSEAANVQQAVESTWISSNGKYLKLFEEEFPVVAGTDQALAVSNGTVALHLALLALGAGPGDEVIVPSMTYIATANTVRYVGAEPVFVDVDPTTWCIDVGQVEAALTHRTVGVIPVDLYGHPADYDPLEELARKHGIWILEDAAEAPFATYKGRPVGSFGIASTFSFYGNKVLTSGEGGAVASSDTDLVATMRLIRGQGMDPALRYYFPIIGHNFRLTNVAAAILCGQLENQSTILANRRQVYSWYDDELQDVPGILPQPRAEWAELSPWLYSVLVSEKSPVSRDELAASLEERGVETRPFFVPIHSLPPYASSRALDMTETDRLARQGINLPTHPALTGEDVAYVAECIREASKGA